MDTTIYLKLDKVAGEVSISPYGGCFEVTSYALLQFGSVTSMSNSSTRVQSRTHEDIQIAFRIGGGFPRLQQMVFQGRSLGSGSLITVQRGVPIIQLDLKDVIGSAISISGMAAQLTLNCTVSQVPIVLAKNSRRP